MKIKKKLIILGLSIALLCGIQIATTHANTCLYPGSGGTGCPSNPVIGYNLYVSSTTPSGTPIFGYQANGSGGGGGGAATTTINGQQCPVFTFSILPTSSPSSITTSSCSLFWNLLAYSSGTDINVTANGVINFVNTPGFISTSTGLTVANFASQNISQWTNDSQYVPSSTASSLYLQIGRNLSDLNSSSTARSNLGVTTVSTSTPFVNTGIAYDNNGSISASSSAQITPSGAVSSSQLYAGSSTLGQGGQTVVISSNILTDASGNKYSTSTSGGSAAGSQSQVQYNDGGFSATSTFTFSSSSQRLTLGAPSSSLFIGTNANFSTSSVTTLPSSTSFAYSGATSSWTVPTGVTSIVLYLNGAVGGGSSLGGSPGLGGSASGTLTVIPGTTYYYCVGGQGTTAQGGSTSPNPGGFCGGAASGNDNRSGSGGGMSWFGASSTFNSSTVAIVAGGGGGGSVTNGGNGGGLTGSAGVTTSVCNGGGGGTQSTAGTGGTTSGGTNGNTGSSGVGGTGGTDSSGNAGSGAGGGYWGGGGGGAKTGTCDGSAGGGSAFIASSLTSTSTASGTNNSTGTIIVNYTVPAPPLSYSTSSAAIYIGGHVATGNQNLSTTTVSSCGINPALQGNDTAANVTVGTGIVTSCQINFGKSFVNAPICTLGTFSTAIIAGISGETTSSLTLGFSASLGGGMINYICLDEL